LDGGAESGACRRVTELADPISVNAYIALMSEIKVRIDAIDDITAEKLRIRSKIAEEYCYLQLRMICEIIAIGCLVIHGNISGAANKTLTQSFKADWIIKSLSRIHEKFYPIPLRVDDEPGDPPSLVPIESGFLTRADLISLYSKECGDRLHRGNARSFMKRVEHGLIKNDVIGWRNKIVALLNKHQIMTPSEKHFVVIMMNTLPEGHITHTVFEKLRD